MSNNRYLYEDLQDLRYAYNRLGWALMDALKPLIIALIWFLDRLIARMYARVCLLISLVSLAIALMILVLMQGVHHE